MSQEIENYLGAGQEFVLEDTCSQNVYGYAAEAVVQFWHYGS